MNPKVQSNFPLTDAIFSSIEQNFEQATAGFALPRVTRCLVHLRQENSPQQRGKDLYIVKLELRGLGLFFQTHHHNLYAAIELAFDQLRREISSARKRRRDLRRQDLRRFAG